MILEQLHRDLVAAAAREHAPRRRAPGVLLPVAAALAVAVVAVMLARGSEPEQEVAVPAPQRVTLAVPGVDPPLAFTAWTSAEGLLCTRLQGRVPERACGDGFTLAEDFKQHGAPVTYLVSRHGGRYVVAGVAIPYVSLLRVRAGDGTRATARLSADTVEVPIRVDPAGLTEAGRRFAASLPEVLRVRPFVASLPGRSAPRTLQLSVTPNRRAEMSVRIPPYAVPGTPGPQRRRISLLERPAQPGDAEAAARVRDEPDPGASGDPSTARVARRYKGRLIYAWTKHDGDVCLSGVGGVGCTTAESAVSDQPMIGGLRGEGVTAVGLIHDGPATITLERRDGTRRTVPVVNNVFVFEDANVVRLRWRGLDGPVTIRWSG